MIIEAPGPVRKDTLDLLPARQNLPRRALDPGIRGKDKPYRLAGDVAGLRCSAVAADETRSDNSHTPTVLVVEDDETTRLAMASWLAGEGFLVLTAGSGHQAIGQLEHPLERIDVVILDVDLPDVSGVALCAKIREMNPELPVLVCTGGATPEEVARLVELGAIRYFRKPVSPDELLSAVEAVLP